MANLATVFFIAVALQAAFAGSGKWESQHRQADEMKNMVQNMIPDIVSAMQNADMESSMGRRYMSYVANDMVYSLEKAFYRMQQVAQAKEGDKREAIQEIAGSVSDIAHAMQQAMNSEPSQMKSQMKSNMEKVPEVANDIAEYIQESQQDQSNANNEMKQVMSTLMTAVQKMNMQMMYHTKSMQEMMTQMEQLVSQMPMYMQNVNSKDEQTANDLTYLVYMVSRKMDVMVSRMEKMAISKDGEAKHSMQEVASRAAMKRAQLEQTANSQDDVQDKISEMKNQLASSMADMVGQMQRAMQAAQANSQDMEMELMVKMMMMDAMAVCKNMQTMLQMIAQNN